jgi:DNA-binding transcriptional regulator YdaS (Cro superfamily)
METAIARAARLAGSQSALASLLGVSPQAVQQWVEKGHPPPERCLAIERAVSGAVTRFELRPDVYGEPPVVPANAQA